MPDTPETPLPDIDPDEDPNVIEPYPDPDIIEPFPSPGPGPERDPDTEPR
jgi:hypothetical protein